MTSLALGMWSNEMFDTDTHVLPCRSRTHHVRAAQHQHQRSVLALRHA